MSIHLSKEIIRLKKMMSELCTAVEESMKLAIVSVINHDAKLAEKVIEHDI